MKLDAADPADPAEPLEPVSSDIDVFGLTDRGRVRADHQDQFLVASLHKVLRRRPSPRRW